MAGVQFALGAEVDIASSGELDAATRGLHNRFDMLERRKNRPSMTYRPINGTFNVGANGGSTTINLARWQLEGPPVGRIWRLQRLTICGGDDHTAVGGAVAALYRGNPSAFQTERLTPSLGDLIIPGVTVPYWTMFSEKSTVIRPNEVIYWIITGASNNQTFAYNADVQEFNIDGLEADYM